MSAITLLICACVVSKLPADGLAQQFEDGRRFEETLDVTSVTRPADDSEAEPVRSRYTIRMETIADAVAGGTASLRSEVLSVKVRLTSPGGVVDTTYDSDDRAVPDLEANVDEAAERANAVLRATWEPLRGVSLRRTATPGGLLQEPAWVGLVAEGDAVPMTDALLESLSTVVSVPLPEGAVESWTSEVRWPTGGSADGADVLRLLTYDGKTADGQDRILISLASRGDTPLVGKGSALFDRAAGRVTTVDLVIKGETSRNGTAVAVTTTNVAWRLTAISEDAETGAIR